MKAFFLFCLISVATGQYCSSITSPLADGATCGGTVKQGCKYTSACINSTCTQVALGKSCATNADCGGIFAQTCIASKCDYSRMPGDPCTLNAQCYSNQCINNKCKALALNAPCNGSDCAVGLFCNNAVNGVCASSISTGSSCISSLIPLLSGQYWLFDYNSICSAGVCDVTADKCTKFFSLGPQSLCDYNEMCTPGLVCSAGYCNAGPSGCNGTTSCATNQACTCDSSSPPKGTCTSETCFSNLQSLYTCLFNSKCNYDGLYGTFNFPASSCNTQCASQTSNYLCCLQKQHGLVYAGAPACPSSASFLGLSVAVIAMAFVASFF